MQKSRFYTVHGGSLKATAVVTRAKRVAAALILSLFSF
jgi:hypothetical protein